jgi:hypothetical protein
MESFESCKVNMSLAAVAFDIPKRLNLLWRLVVVGRSSAPSASGHPSHANACGRGNIIFRRLQVLDRQVYSQSTRSASRLRPPFRGRLAEGVHKKLPLAANMVAMQATPTRHERRATPAESGSHLAPALPALTAGASVASSTAASR